MESTGYVFNKDRIAQVAAELASRKAARRDFCVDRNKLHVSVIDKQLVLKVDGAGLAGAPEMYSFRRHSLTQLAAQLEIPLRYIDRLTNAGHADIAAANLTRLLEREPKRHLVRTLGTRFDSIHSDKYRSIDNEMLFFICAEECKRAGAMIWDARVSDDEFRFLAVAPHIAGQVRTDRSFSGPARWEGSEGDTVNAAFTAGNGETGLSSMWGKPSVLRKVCQNFQVWTEGVKRIHIGKKIDTEGEIFFSDETKKMEDQVLMSKVRDLIRTTFDPVAFKSKLEILNRATQVNLPENKATEVVDATIKTFGLPLEHREAILAELLGSRDMTQYGLAQAITAQVNPKNAGKLDDETKSAFEDAGGILVAMTDTQLVAMVG